MRVSWRAVLLLPSLAAAQAADLSRLISSASSTVSLSASSVSSAASSGNARVNITSAPSSASPSLSVSQLVTVSNNRSVTLNVTVTQSTSTSLSTQPANLTTAPTPSQLVSITAYAPGGTATGVALGPNDGPRADASSASSSDADEASDDEDKDNRAAMLAALEAHQMSLLGGALPFASTCGKSNGRAKEVKEAKSVWEMDDADFDDDEDSEDDEEDVEDVENEEDERGQSASKAATVVAFVEPGREASNLAAVPSAPLNKRELRDFKAGKIKNLHTKRSIADEHNFKYVGGAVARKKAALAAGDAKGAATAQKEEEDQVEENHLIKLDSHLASLVKPLTSGTGSSSLPDLLRELPLEPAKALKGHTPLPKNAPRLLRRGQNAANLQRAQARDEAAGFAKGAKKGTAGQGREALSLKEKRKVDGKDKRQRGLGGAMGKWGRGQIRLSKKEVMSINGTAS
ncbi:hypothetical protein Rt10032_c01g0116 [Rhodotorula toruloides]|uniref:Uncharacterized protein n=1 Tax=Rhodotorula toruloides TaxID=5286 RepID=A0A511K6X7_RHOTO|nr:hypothetical protein Rt10032_c01g0116 [Rhodotorula toruloides]